MLLVMGLQVFCKGVREQKPRGGGSGLESFGKGTCLEVLCVFFSSSCHTLLQLYEFYSVYAVFLLNLSLDTPKVGDLLPDH